MKRFVPKFIKLKTLKVVEQLDGVSIRFFSLNARFAGLYYFLLNRRFDREHLAVLRGRLEYYRKTKDVGDSSPLLRRNVHRLEKGLIMRPRRRIFAEDYIEETVLCFAKAVRSEAFSTGELKWAVDVLGEYFRVVGKSEITFKARKIYSKALSAEGVAALMCSMSSDESWKPYARSGSPACTITIDELSSLFTRRRSVRWYADSPVAAERIKKIINVSSTAPSACNRQPYRFIFSNSVEDSALIASHAGGTRGYAENIPAIIIVVGDLSAYPKERDRHLIYIDASLASMQVMLAAESAGLATCPINWPDIETPELAIQKLLSLSSHERVIMLIAIGYADPAGGIAYSQKKRNEMLITEFSAR